MNKLLQKIFIVFAVVSILLPTHALALDQEQRFDIERRPWFDKTDCPSGGGSKQAVGDVDRFLQVLADQESGGDPQAQASGSSASGKYQYLDSTWRARADLYPPSAQYPEGKAAPENIQDAVAYIEYAQKFKQYNGDIFKLAISHFYPAANTNPSKLDELIGSNSITPRQYANSIVNKIQTGVGQNIPLFYKDAPQFEEFLQAATGPTEAGPTSGTTKASDSNNCSAAEKTTGNAEVVRIAQAELAAGISEADNGYHKYTMGRSEAWCADFVTWVFKEAGSPFTGGNDGWNIPAVASLLANGQQNGWFHPRGEANFTPQPGDIAIYKEGRDPYPSHTNIVVNYDGAGTYTSIGGNEGDRIKQSEHSINAPYLTGFIRKPAI